VARSREFGDETLGSNTTDLVKKVVSSIGTHCQLNAINE
jgi:hypothetical protein